MTARILGSYVAVEPLQQGEDGRYGSIITPGTGRAAATILARVLAVGAEVGMVVAEGDIVLVERQSGHPGQAGALDAAHFGGTPGRFAVLVPCEPGPKAAGGDDEHDRVAADLAALKSRWKLAASVPPEIERQARRYDARLAEIDSRRAGHARTRRLKQTLDAARGRGILAVVDLEPGDTLESVAAAIA